VAARLVQIQLRLLPDGEGRPRSDDRGGVAGYGLVDDFGRGSGEDEAVPDCFRVAVRKSV